MEAVLGEFVAVIFGCILGGFRRSIATQECPDSRADLDDDSRGPSFLRANDEKKWLL
jgi:hypothetical protein